MRFVHLNISPTNQLLIYWTTAPNQKRLRPDWSDELRQYACKYRPGVEIVTQQSLLAFQPSGHTYSISALGPVQLKPIYGIIIGEIFSRYVKQRKVWKEIISYQRMPQRKGLLAPQNTFLDTIATRFDGTRKLALLFTWLKKSRVSTPPSHKLTLMQRICMIRKWHVMYRFKDAEAHQASCWFDVPSYGWNLRAHSTKTPPDSQRVHN